MKKCDPMEMRKNLEVVEVLKNAGIDFVPIPVKNQEHKEELVALGHAIFDEILDNV